MTAPSGPTTSTGSPSTKEPVTPVMPAGRSERPRSRRAVTAPSSICTDPRGVVAWASQSARDPRLRRWGWKTVPTSSPARAPAIWSAEVSTVGIPAAPAMVAASTFVVMPPEPTADPVPPMEIASSSAGSVTTATRSAPGVPGLAV